MKRIIYKFGIAVMAMVFTGCKDDNNDPTALTLSATAVDVEVDGTATVTISGGTPDFTVSSSDEKVATVTVSGTTISVKGVNNGTSLVTVKDSDNASSTFAVSVNDEQILFGPDKTQLAICTGK